MKPWRFAQEFLRLAIRLMETNLRMTGMEVRMGRRGRTGDEEEKLALDPSEFAEAFQRSLSKALAEETAKQSSKRTPPATEAVLRSLAVATVEAAASQNYPSNRPIEIEVSADKCTELMRELVETDPRLIDRADVHEKRDVHPFLAEHTYFLHPALETIVSEPAIGVGTEFRPDFIIREATGDYILVEIENPKRTLFTKRGDFTAEVSHAVQQVEDWQEWLEQNLPTAQRQYPDIVSPRGLTVMGRHVNLGQKERQKLSRRNINTRGRLEIITYDELIARTRAYLAGVRRNLGA